MSNIHHKGWGFENWIVNKPEYCGKLLYFREGKMCSWHYHKLKDETFLLDQEKYNYFMAKRTISMNVKA